MKYIYLEINSRTGHFDLIHPQDESISMDITVWDEGRYRINDCSITSESEYSTDDFDPETIVDEVAKMIEDYQKRLWISSNRERDLEFAKWLRKNKKKLLKGNKIRNHEKLLKRKEQLEKELESINRAL